MGGLLAKIFTGLGQVQQLLQDQFGRPFRDWADWAEVHPGPAARQLEVVAAVWEGRSKGYRNQHGWRARRDRGIVEALREQAAAMRDGDTKACRIKPGTKAAA